MAATKVEAYDPATKTWLDKVLPTDHNVVHAAIRKVCGNVPTEIKVFSDGKIQVIKPALTAAQKIALTQEI